MARQTQGTKCKLFERVYIISLGEAKKTDGSSER